MRRRDFLAEHIAQKSVVEDVMKSFAWTTLCGTVYAMAISALKAEAYFQGLAIFAVFLLLSTSSVMYVALYVVIPLDSAMYPTDPYWDEKAQKLTGMPRLLEAVKVFLTRKHMFYLVVCLGYFLYAHRVASYLGTNVVKG
ncbi:MAG: hypothetical protein NT087_13555 [Deltaproteobacteria bacterium]|nr:hypothetical protein [Deltaproteobacteria bacterium]